MAEQPCSDCGQPHGEAMPLQMVTQLPPAFLDEIMRVVAASFKPPRNHKEMLYLSAVIEVVGAKMLERMEATS